MVENNQFSDETKNNSTDTSSTDVSPAVIGNHENAVVPHKISNHDKLVQTMVMVDGEWINVNDTNDQANTKEDVHKVNKKVVEAQKGIVEAKNSAESAVKYADSAVSASKVNSDAIVAMNSAVAVAQDGVNSAAAAIQQTRANAASDAASIRDDVASVKNDVNTAKVANESEIKSIQDDLKVTSSSIDTVKTNLGSVSSKLDTYAKSAADQGHDITAIKQKQGQFEVDYAGTKGDVNQIQADIKGLSDNLKDSDGDVASLQVTAKRLQAAMSDAQGNVSDLQFTAKKYEQTFEDHAGRISKVEQTASTLTNEFSDQQGHLNRVEQTANGTKQTVADQQGQINTIKTDAKGIQETLTGQGGQIATINATLNGLDTKYEGVSGNLSKLSGTVATNSTQITQNKKEIDLKADQSTVANLSGEVSQNTAQLKVQAGQISSKVSSEDFKTLDDKVGGAIAQISKNTTAIDQTKEKISLKADQTEVEAVKGTASNNSSQLDIMKDEIRSKVTSTDVDNIINGKGFATTNTVQSLITQKAGTINESITNLEGEFNSSSSVNLAEKTNQGTTNWICNSGTGTTNLTEVNINGVRGVRFNNIRKTTSWWVAAYQLNLDYFEPNQDYIISFDIRTSSDNFNQGGALNIARDDSSHPYLADTGFKTNFKQNQLTHVSCTGHSYSSLDKNGETFYLNCAGLGQCDWVDIVNFKIARGTIDKGYSPAPSDNATVTQLQSVTASIDGLQSNVTNLKNDTSTKITQLSNTFNSKIGDAQVSISDLKDKTLWKDTASIDLNNAVSQHKLFVRGGSNLPPGPYWWYVQVEGGYNNRIVQYAVSDRDNKHFSRQYNGAQWSAWTQDVSESDITQLRDEINLRVKKGNVISQINLEAGNALIQSGKIYLDAESVVFGKDSTAFIPSAYITEINADKITTGTLDASKFNVKNFSADNITGGTLSGVVVKTGTKDRYFQTSKDNIYWVRKGSMSLVGNDTYLNSANGLNIADMNNIQLTTWGGATVNKDGSITNNSGNSGHPKIVIDDEGKYNPDDPYGSDFGGGPGDNEITQWAGNKEYTALTRNQGFTVHLNDGNNKSIFSIQKDNRLFFDVGGGDNGNEIQIVGSGPIKLQGEYINDGFNDAATHTFGNIQVDNLHVRKWLGVDKSKNAIVKTSQGSVTINAYETAEYYFGDIGEGQTSTDGIAYIGIEKLFNETVNTTIPYHVFITAYGPGNIWVDQREYNRFVVKSDQPNLKFSWEIKAKRKGYEQTRLQNVDDKLNHMAATS